MDIKEVEEQLKNAKELIWETRPYFDHKVLNALVELHNAIKVLAEETDRKILAAKNEMRVWPDSPGR
jgi:hypothetical protein